MVARPAPTLPDWLREQYPWEGRLVDVGAGSMHVLDEGPRDAPVLLCLHGNPTWSFYWRAVVRAFSDRYRVVVPDHLGCGLSDKPQQWEYRLAQHVDNLERVVDSLGIERATFVLHDWGGAIGMGLATRRPAMADGFVVTNTAAFRSLRIPPSIATVKVPLFGALAVRGFNAFAQVATLRAVSQRLPPAARKGLLYPYDTWANRIATLRFVQDIPLHASHPSYAELSRIDDGLAGLAARRMMLCWGDDDFCFTPRFRAEWERRFPDAEVHAWKGVGHYVMEDAPQRVIDHMTAFLAAGTAEVAEAAP